MNKHFFRVVHNRALGLPQVAAEITRRLTSGTASASRSSGPRRLVAGLVLGWIGWLPIATAQIAADPTAPGSQRPTVLQAPNGVPLVNIQTPSAAGVSRNAYRQFDIHSDGAILNNSRTDTQSQLGGWVQGNPWLAGGTARIILNEVNTSDPSQLHGYIEVAGNRAQVVIANPAGISCDGCGFINANQATLTTGIPVLKDGRLDGYHVQRGRIQIEGAGLDARDADHTELLARAVQVNAGIWGQRLEVVVGANQIGTDQALLDAAQVGVGPAPAFALDVSALGGMYAGKITLVGTEHGVGVRNAGTIGAQAGNLVVTVDGRLENSGALQSKHDTRILANAGVRNSGTISAVRELHLNTEQDLVLTSHGHADSSAGLLAAGDTLTVNADSIAGNGRILSQGDLKLALRQSFTHDGEIIASGRAEVSSAGRLANHGSIRAGDLEVRARKIDNAASGEMSGGRTYIDATDTATNRGLIDGQSTRIEAAAIDNVGTGRLYGDHLALQANTISNREETIAGVTQAATIAARERLDIGAETLINREQALIFSAGSSEQALNIGGALDADGLATGRAGLVHNASATIESLGGLRLDATRLLNSNEHFVSALAQIAGPLQVTYIQPSGDPNKYDINNFIWEGWSRAGRYRWKSDPPLDNSGVLGASPVPRVGEQDCVGDGDHEVCTRLPGADYPTGDPAWAYFGVPAPSSEPLRPAADDYTDAESYQTALSAWQIAHAAWVVESEARYETLDAQIAAYNEHMTAQLVKHWTQYEVTRTEHRTQVTSSAPGLIRSGGAMRLSGGELINDKSQIIAGGALSGDLHRLHNIDAVGQQIIHEEGTSQYTYSRWRGGFKRYHEREWNAKIDYAPAAQVTTFNLNVAGVKSRTNAAGSGYRIGSYHDGAVPALPGSLFQLQPESGSYLIETDPRFTDHRAWLSSDYLLQQLALDPTTVQKRLGDGFYEQRLIREQVGQLTGRRFLEGYASDEAQYQALLTAGATIAQAWDLRPGIALTAEQVSQLTSDIVWLVEEPVHLPDGSVTTALVPRVYLLPRPGDLDGNGTLIAAETIAFELSDDLVNSGTLAGRSTVQITAENLRNLGGRIDGGQVTLHARTDLDNIGGILTASDGLAVTAGRDLTIASTTHSDARQAGLSDFSRTNLDRVAGLYVTNSSGNLVAMAGRDVHLAAAEVSNAGVDGQTLLAASRDLNLATVQVAEQENNVRNADNYLKQGYVQDVGTSVHTQGSLHLQAGGDLNSRAAHITSEQGALVAIAKGDVNILSGETGSNWSEGRRHKHNGLLGSSTKTTRSSLEETAAAGSAFSGQTVAVHGQNITVSGSSIVSDDATTLAATNDLTIEAATNTRSESHFKRTDKRGLFSNGIDVTLGKQMQQAEQEITQTVADGSTIGSLRGDVKLIAGNQYRQAGSDVLAPKGDINIIAKAIAITETRETSSFDEQLAFKQSGVSASISATIIDALQTTDSLVSATRQVESGRMQALGAATAALNAKEAYDSGKNITGAVQGEGDISQAAGLRIAVSIGSAKSKSHSVQTSDTARGSTIQAGGSLRLLATGAGEASNLLVQGSEIRAGDNAILLADNRLDLIAAQNQAALQSTERSSSGSIGVGFHAGREQSGLTLNAAAAQGRGKADGTDVWHSNSRITAGNTVQLISGGDTTIRGAQVTGHAVKADIGGDLNLESLQDTSTYASKQKHTGGGVSVCIPPLCAGPAASANAALNRAKASGRYASVVEQLGIQAGDGGFNIRVDGSTDLTGAVIASTQAASETGKNSLVTSTLTTSDIDNHAEASAKSSGISASSDLLSQGKYGLAKAGIGMVLNKGSASDSSSGSTKSAVSAGEVVITDGVKQKEMTGGGVEETVAALNRDTENTHAAAAELDVQKLEERAQAEQTIKQEAYRQINLITDAVYTTDNGPKKIILSTCGAGSAECKSQEIDLDNHALVYGVDGKLYVFNNGIFNDEHAALFNAAKQHGEAALAQGVYAVINPYTGSPLSEVIYAGLDKIREVTGLVSVFGISNASQANIELRNMVAEYNRRAKATGEMPVMIFEVDHSRGSLTSSIATQAQIKAGETGVPLGHVLFHGAAANAQRMADRVEQVTSGAGTVWQSTHKDDAVGILIGGNKATGGVDGTLGDAHSSYGQGVPDNVKEELWGSKDGSKSTRLKPRK